MITYLLSGPKTSLLNSKPWTNKRSDPVTGIHIHPSGKEGRASKPCLDCRITYILTDTHFSLFLNSFLLWNKSLWAKSCCFAVLSCLGKLSCLIFFFCFVWLLRRDWIVCLKGNKTTTTKHFAVAQNFRFSFETLKGRERKDKGGSSRLMVWQVQSFFQTNIWFGGSSEARHEIRKPVSPPLLFFFLMFFYNIGPFVVGKHPGSCSLKLACSDFARLYLYSEVTKGEDSFLLGW